MFLRSACGAARRITDKTKSSFIFRRVHRAKAFGGQPGEPIRQQSEKSRDPKDYKRYVGRPDDHPKKTVPQKHTGKQDEAKQCGSSVHGRDVKNACDRPVKTGESKRWVNSHFSPDRSSLGKASRNKPVNSPELPAVALSKMQLSQRSSLSCLNVANSRKDLDMSEDKTDNKKLPPIGEDILMPHSNEEVNLKELASTSSLADTASPPAQMVPKICKKEVSQKTAAIPLAIDATREVVLASAVHVPPTAHKAEPQETMPENGKSRSRVEIKIPAKLKFTREGFQENKRHRVYAFGFTETGALGLYKPKEGRRWRKFIPRPLRHQFAEENRIISAESGYGFTLFYVKNNDNVKLFGCGLNSDFQLGPVERELVEYPVPVDIQIRSPQTKIVSVSAGRAHSAVATDNEGVFLFGSNSYGQCGRDVREEDSTECTITQIKNFGGEKVVSVQCGQDHSCFVTETGKVYSCGLGSEGQTGLGHTQQMPEPTIVEGDIKREKIVKVAGKCDTVLALNDKGDLFGWGSNEFRQVNNNQDWAQVDSPLFLEHVRKRCGKIVDVAAGSSFCIVLNEEGDVFVWGHGILGGGPELSKTPVPTLLPRTLFGANEYNPKAHPVKVYCGLDHMAAMNNLRHVYAWGKNKHGCLGIGTSRDQYFPYKLAISADAVHISCAVDHSIVVTGHE